MTAITAITAQNTLGVQLVDVVSSGMVLAQIDSVIRDIGVDAIKIGMLGSKENAIVVAERLSGLAGHIPIVFDPVMVATSGTSLADQETVEAFTRLMRIATLTTPNLPELEALGGQGVALAHTQALLVKGGHAEGSSVTDRLMIRDGDCFEWQDTRIDTPHTHGTGCTLASAIATGLAQGMTLPDSIARARAYVRAALIAAPGLGQGHGPMGFPVEPFHP